MKVRSNRLLVLFALSLVAPASMADGAQDANQRTREKPPVQDARGAQGQGTPARQNNNADEQARQRKEQQAREAAEKKRAQEQRTQDQRQGERQPDAQRPQDPVTDQQKLEQRKANAREQQQTEQEQLEQRKANAREKQQEAAGAGTRGALPAAQREAVDFWAAEMSKHRDRTARLERLLELATAAGDRAQVTEINQLMARENNRHQGKLARIEGGMDPAVLRQLQGRYAKSGGAAPQGRQTPPADGAGKQEPAPVGDQRGALGGARKDAPGGKTDAPPSRPQ